MAIYEFKCESCGAINTRRMTFEEYDELNGDIAPNVCQECGDSDLRRVYYGVTVNWNFPGSTRHTDPAVERGLAKEREVYGDVLTDQQAKVENEWRNLGRTGDRLAEMDAEGPMPEEDVAQVLREGDDYMQDLMES